MYEVCGIRKRRAIKYVDSVFDSRDGNVWHIKFRSVLGEMTEEDVVFRIENDDDIRKVYKYLDEKVV